LALGALAAGVSDQAGRPAGDGDWVVTEQLKASQAEKRDEVADVQAVGRRVEAAVEHDGAGGEALRQLD